MAKTNYALITGLTVAATLGGLLFGYDTAVISGATDAIKVNFVDPRHLDEGTANFLHGFAVSCALLGCVLGALAAGPISTRIGRKWGLLIAGVLFFLSSVGAGYPEFIWSAFGAVGEKALPAFIFYRVMGGVAIGMASMLAPMYISEMAPTNIRGMLLTFEQIAIVVGINLVYFVNFFIQSGRSHDFLMREGWRFMLASAAIPATLLIVFMCLVPETPRFLVLKDRHDEAKALLKRLFGSAEEAEKTHAEIKATLVEHTRPLFSYGVLILVVGILLSVFQQAVGINAVLYFAPHMFENMGSTPNEAYLQSAWFVGVSMTLFTLVATFTVEKFGRKPLLFWGAVVMAVAMVTLGFLFHLHLVSATGASGAAAGGSSVLAIAAVVLYIVGFSFSWGPIVWVLLAEIFPNSIKGQAMSIAVAAQWIANFIVSQTFPMMDGSTVLNQNFNHGFAYWIYGVASALAAWFVLRYVPETKGRSLEEMEQVWHRKKA
ncbi:SP family xylose:H+ symportor-like MFS transporter [Rhizomicrobium palustre]|uniref:SP family xylose:H+ symportor-like MFS transporter n=1 Tax=Rhizomicrobium palustre TaxID=189966 RepID=A0A846MVR0_9PROT|nr:sugar porter family MFS transporter [Rhizomicrobium palustre]NIK87305.1 SP family xylose:H+ symportor-like MFS transporter [Rhizomicrobium palustre]